jgi:hypothetical protein
MQISKTFGLKYADVLDPTEYYDPDEILSGPWFDDNNAIAVIKNNETAYKIEEEMLRNSLKDKKETEISRDYYLTDNKWLNVQIDTTKDVK